MFCFFFPCHNVSHNSTLIEIKCKCYLRKIEEKAELSLIRNDFIYKVHKYIYVNIRNYEYYNIKNQMLVIILTRLNDYFKWQSFNDGIT